MHRGSVGSGSSAPQSQETVQQRLERLKAERAMFDTVTVGTGRKPLPRPIASPSDVASSDKGASAALDQAPVYKFQLAETFEYDVPNMRQPTAVTVRSLRTATDPGAVGRRVVPLTTLPAQEGVPLAPTPDIETRHPPSNALVVSGPTAATTAGDVADADELLMLSIQQATSRRPNGGALSVLTETVAPNDDAEMSRLHTGSDAISYFSTHGSTSAVKFVYCNQVIEERVFRPYDLSVVRRAEQNPEHYVISSSGVVHVRPSQPSEVITLSDWIRESALFNVLRRVRFFRTYLTYKAFVQWRKNIRQKLFLETRRSLCKRFFLSKATFAAPTMELLKTAFELTTAPLFHYEPQGRGDYTIEEFNGRQSEMRMKASQDFSNTLERMEQRLTKLTETVQQRANVPDLTTMESLEQYLLAHSTASSKDRKGGKKMKSMLDAKQEQHERMRELKRSMVEYSMLDSYIRLIDYAAAENVFRNGLLTVVKFFETVRDANPDDEVKRVRFQVLIQASEDAMRFKPGEQEIAKTYTDLVEEIVQTVNGVNRLMNQKPLKIFFAKPPKFWNIGTEFKRDARVLATKRMTYELIKSDFVEAQDKMKHYDNNRQWIAFIDVQWPEIRRKWAATATDLRCEDIQSVYRRLAAAQESFGRLYTEYVGHLLFINAQRLKADLQPKLDKIQAEVNTSLNTTAVARIKSLETYFTACIKKIHLDPKDPNPKMSLSTFYQFVSALRDIQAEEHKVEADIEEAESLYSLIFEQKVEMSDTDKATKDRTLGGMQQNVVSETSTREKFNTAKSHADTFAQGVMPTMLTMLESEILAVNEDCNTNIQILDDEEYTSLMGVVSHKLYDSPPAYQALHTLGDVEDKVKALKDKADNFSRYYKLFTGKDSTSWRDLDHLVCLFNARKEMWTLLRTIDESCFKWWNSPLASLDSQEVETGVRDFHKRCVQLGKVMREGVNGIGFKDTVGSDIGRKVEELRAKVPVILDCANKYMTKDHWTRVLNTIPKAGTWNEGLSLKDLDFGEDEMGNENDIFAHREKIEQAAAAATGEFNLRNALDDIKKVWDVVEFSCKKYKEDRDVYIIDKLDEVIQQLDDHHVNLQTILASRHVTNVRPKVEEWVTKLRTVSDVIEEWITMQKNWMYLEFIFSAEDIKKQLVQESERFELVDKFFKTFSNKALTVKNVLIIATEEKVLSQLKSFNKAIDEIQKKLEDYLELKRSAFPRFYFLSNDELLAILSDVRNPRAVEPHLPKCFDAIAGLSFANEAAREICGMKSGEGEVVSFQQPVLPIGNVEVWLRHIESTMRTSLMTHMRETYDAYVRRVREQWYFDYPAQCVQAVDMIYWTGEVEQAIADRGLAVYQKKYITQLLNTVKLVQGQLSKLQRTLVCTLIVVDVHNRDIVTRLIDSKVQDVQDFEWIQQLRYYWENDASQQHHNPDAPVQKNCSIHHCNAHLWYGYEYLGNQPRLVITPLTDRAFLTCTGALAMNLGAAPQGPAGTGKTESVKDLGKALARQVVVFNCSDGINYKTMSRMFAGLAQAGAWACFDEFNRIELEVLSVIAQQMLEIVTALGQKIERLDFDGRKITLSKNFGVFITMNPGYAGRTELPDNLKALFRPICMMIPDYALIAEIMFYSEGFADARTLAQKMVQLYKLSSEQLSKQKHYDFGMRAVKSILVMAGGLKRANPNENEDMLLIRAMRDSNVPKFLRDDTVLFMALIRDLFPTVDIRDQPNQLLIQYIENDMRGNNLQTVPGFVLKAVQLFDTLVVRHGVMMVGATMCAKTTILETLQRSLTKLKMDNADPEGNVPLYNVVKTHVLNPKAVTMGELYGEVNVFTREWTDGLLSGIARGVKDEADRKNAARQWIVFDGPVDAVWIENMNTVLDDNKMLCLFNGERIKLPATATFMFEVQDLKVASPATVSRCGMVFLEPFYLDGGWKPVAKSLINTLSQSMGNKFRGARALELLEKLCPDSLSFLRASCKEYVPSVDAQLVVSCLHLLQGFLTTVPMSEHANAVGTDEPVETLDPLMSEFRRPPLPTKVAAQDSNVLFDLCFVMAFIWSIGGNVADADRQKLSDFIKPKLEAIFPQLPKDPDQSIFSFTLHRPSLSFVPWACVVTDFQYNRSLPYFELFVPTAETTSIKTVMHALVTVNRNILLSGVTGVGKSAVAMDFICNTLRADNPNEPFEYFTTCFSAQTRAADLLERMEGKLNKIKAQLLGATPGKKAIFFIDDINMPALEKYGASPPIEVLRQLMSQRGFYDLKKKPALFKEVQDLLFIAACGVPGGGRNELTQRLTSRHHMLCQPSVTTLSMKRIFTLILGGFLSVWSMDVRRIASKLVEATKTCYERISAEKLPTPAKSHYTFNLRDFGKVIQGLLQASPNSVTDSDGFIRLFIHEVSRVFHDRLADDDDRKWWWATLMETVTKQFDVTWSSAYDSLLFGDFMRAENRMYEEVADIGAFQDKLADYQMSYNLDNNKEAELVFFRDAAHHIARICRICRQPRGNALLVGVGGSGRQSLTRLAAYICGMPLYQISISRTYGITEFRDDLKEALLESGCENKPVVFLLSDSQIVKEQFLEDVNNILNTGEVPNLMQSEDNDKIIEAMRKFVKAAGKQETRGVLLAQFTLQCRDNFHIVLTMSPVGDSLRRRLRMFPSLVNCTTIDWFSKWPADALNIVALRVLNKLPLDEAMKHSLAKMCVRIHEDVQLSSVQFFDELRRHNYTTPTSYLELLNSYQKMLEEQGTIITAATKRLQGGLDKLQSTQVMVDDMKVMLTKMQPVLETAAKDTERMMIEVEQQQKEAEVIRTNSATEEKAAATIQIEADGVAAKCEAEVAKAMPIMEAAVAALDTINSSHINEIKSLKEPPDRVKTPVEAVMVLLGVKDLSWNNLKIVMSKPSFIPDLKSYKRDEIADKVIRQLRKNYTQNPEKEFTVENFTRGSEACGSLAKWVLAIDNFYDVNKVILPMQEQLAEAKGRLATATESLRKAQQQLAAVEARVSQLKKAMQETIEKKKSLEEEMKLTELRLSRAGKLMSGLASEQVRWSASVVKLKQEHIDVVGTVVLAAGCVAYLGPFTAPFRAKMIANWAQTCQQLNIPVAGQGFSLASVADPVKVRQWNQKGLPSDTFSIENGVIVARSQRWCLCIDPQGQANAWIRAMERDNNLKIIKLSDPNYMRTLENAIKVGIPVLLENIEESIDAAIDPLLLRQTFKHQGRLLLRLGDTDIDYEPNFRFYITTKLPNPHYMPELQIKVTVINFTVTPKGLEDQLLADVVRYERADLEQRADKTVTEISEGKSQLKDIEDRILQLLASSGNNILDTDDLVNTLADAKKTSDAVSHNLQVAEATQRDILAARERYRPVATRGSLIYTVIAEVGGLEHMYQYSLDFFKRLFMQTLRRTETNDDVEKRVASLLPAVTQDSYNTVCRGLFERDKQLFAFLMVSHIFRDAGEMSEEEWGFFCRGGEGRGQLAENESWPEQFNEATWREVAALTRLTGFEHLKGHIFGEEEEWLKWVASDNAYRQFPPSAMSYTPWQRLLFLRIFREDLLLYGISVVIGHYLGKSFTESPAFDLEAAFEDSSPTAPIIFVLTTGTDPTVTFTEFAEKKNFSDRKMMLSLGQDQGPKAQEMINVGCKTGQWVYLQNCHVYASWMPSLERALEEVMLREVNRDFRLWLTTMPTASFPVLVLQSGIKVTKEPPKGLKANLRDSFLLAVTPEIWEGSKNPNAWKRLLFSLAYFHAVIQERRKFGALGWNIPYEWNQSDFAASIKTLALQLADAEEGTVPWPALKYITGMINYGGRVTDFLDQRCLQTILGRFFDPVVINGRFNITADGVYCIPEDIQELSVVKKYLGDLPPFETPELFGLHSNADITYNRNSSRRSIDALLTLQPRAKGGGGGSNTDDKVFNDCARMLNDLPPPIDKSQAHEDTYRITEAGTMVSLGTVCSQEVDVFNFISDRLKKWLKELIKAIRGEVVMSSSLESMYNAIAIGRVPESWHDDSYLSLKPLASWFADTLRRIEFLRDWNDNGPPMSFWISGFYFPQGFLTGVLQTHSRAHKIPVDDIKFRTHIMRQTSGEEIEDTPESGVYIHGLYLEGARLDKESLSLTESLPGELFTPMNVIWLEPVLRAETTSTAKTFGCPMYKTSSRAGALSTTGLSTNFVLPLDLNAGEQSPAHWILRGVALLCMLDT